MTRIPPIYPDASEDVRILYYMKVLTIPATTPEIEQLHVKAREELAQLGTDVESVEMEAKRSW
jgi:hypothetical protein